MQTIFGFVNIFAYEGPSLLAKETLFIVKLTDRIFERNAKRRENNLAIRKQTDLMRKDFHMKTIRNYLDRKGQGIVEYALLLSFIVGLAMMLNGANLGGTVKGVFDDVAGLLGGEKSAAKTYADYFNDWSKMSQDQLWGIDNNERIRADREALHNLGKAFLGMTKDEVLANMDAYQKKFDWKYNDSTGKWTSDGGNFTDQFDLKAVTHYNENGEIDKLPKVTLDYGDGKIKEYWGTNGDYGGFPLLYYVSSETGTALNAQNNTTFNSGLLSNNWAASWMNGDYESSAAWDNDTRYFYSDFMTGKGNDSRKNVIATFSFDDSGKVSATRVYATDNAGRFGKDLDITVTKDGFTDTKVSSNLSGKYAY